VAVLPKFEAELNIHTLLFESCYFWWSGNCKGHRVVKMYACVEV